MAWRDIASKGTNSFEAKIEAKVLRIAEIAGKNDAVIKKQSRSS